MTAIDHAPLEVARAVAGATADESAPRLAARRGAMLRWLSALVAVVVAALALTALHNELRTYHLDDIRRSIAALPASRLLLACALVIPRKGNRKTPPWPDVAHGGPPYTCAHVPRMDGEHDQRGKRAHRR